MKLSAPAPAASPAPRSRRARPLLHLVAAPLLFLGFLAPAGAESPDLRAVRRVQLEYHPPDAPVRTAAGRAAPADEAPSFQKQHPLEQAAEAGDVFYVHGERRELWRSTSEVAVGWRRGVAAARRAPLGRILPPDVAATPIYGLRGGDLDLLGLTGVARPVTGRRSPMEAALIALRAHPDVEYAYPALVHPESGFRFLPTPEIMVALDDASGVTVAEIEAAHAISYVPGADSVAGDWRMFRVNDPRRQDPVAVAAGLHGAPGVRWAEPHWQAQIEWYASPNDPYFAQQWEHLNLGLNGSLADADPDTAEAWDLSYGSPQITVAVIDSGIQPSHPDLAANMWTNPGETAGNGIDDDANGYIDDVYGWDFYSNDNDPGPSMNVNDFEGHGMGSAGIVAAVINNGVGTAGTANVKLMALRMNNDSAFASYAAISNAVNYAWQEGADVQSHSWGTPLSASSSSTALDTAIANSVTNGRGGKGTAVFFATGNAASLWNNGGLPFRLEFAGLAGGTSYRMGVRVRRTSTQGGTQEMGFDNIILPDGTRHSFEPSIPAGWVKGPSSTFIMSNLSGANAMNATASTNSFQNPTLTNTQSADLVSPVFVNTLNADGETFVQLAIRQNAPRSIAGTRRMEFFLDFYQTTGAPTSGNYIGSLDLSASFVAQPGTLAAVSWPASNANTIAVGSATDHDDRADYSQYGTNLDFVVSSNGGWHPTWSIDATGDAGWSAGLDGNYKDFGGTSSACPKAAAIAGLILGRYPQLTAAQLRTVMRHTADKVHAGTRYTYDSSGFTSQMGYGRLNANRAVRFAGPSDADTDSMMFTMAGTGMQTISSQPIDILLANRSDAGVLLLSIFDGDSGAGTSGWASGHWDYSTQTVTYELYADPNKTGTGMTLLNTFNSGTLPNNAWSVNTITNAAAAQNANGHYYYRLRATPSAWSGTWANSFKIGSNAQMSIPAGYYIFQNTLYTQGDLAVVYPGYVGPDNPGTAAIDTTMRLFPYYATAPSTVTVWDADFDYGDLNWGAGVTPPSVTNPDTDDANTAPGDRPPAFAGVTKNEGVQTGQVIKNSTPYTLNGVGNPPDNERRAFRRVNPTTGQNVAYAVRLPGTATEVWNTNPSGDGEWERFVLAAGASATADFANLGAMGSGFARLTVSGLDWSNIAGFYLERETFFSDDATPLGGITTP